SCASTSTIRLKPAYAQPRSPMSVYRRRMPALAPAKINAHADFAVDDAAFAADRGERRCHLGEPPAHRVAISALSARAGRTPFGQRAVTVVLDLEGPGRVGERLTCFAEQHGAQIGQRGCERAHLRGHWQPES